MSEIIQLDNFVQRQSLIETNHNNGNTWVKTKIINIYEKFIEVSQVEEYIKSLMLINDPITCRIDNGTNVVIMDAQIYNIKFTSGSVVLKINNIYIRRKMRKHKRYDVYLSAAFCKKEEVYENYAVVVNVSLSGFCIITRSNLEKGDIIELRIKRKNNLLTADCKVNWTARSGKSYVCGLSIISMNDYTKTLYKSFIGYLRRKDKQIGQKLSEHDSV